MKINSASLFTVLCWLVFGCSQSEVQGGGEKKRQVEEGAPEGSQDATVTNPGGPVSPAGSGAQGGQGDPLHPDNHGGSTTPVNNTPDNKGSDSPTNQPPGQPPESNTPSTTEPPLTPSKLGWNGSQLIGTNQLYFLPLD